MGMCFANTPSDVVALRRPGELLLIGPPQAFGTAINAIRLTDPWRLRALLHFFMRHDDERNSLIGLHQKFGGSVVTWQWHPDQIASHIASSVDNGALIALLLPDESGHEGGGLIPPASTQLPASANVAQWSDADKFIEVLKRTPNHLEGTLKESFQSLLSPETLAMIAGALALWAASHMAAGAGFGIDAILIAVGLFLVGWSIFDAAGKIIDFIARTHNARSHQELDQAAKIAAAVVAALSVEMFESLLTRGASRLKRAAPMAGSGAAQHAPQSRSRTEADQRATAHTGRPTRQVPCFNLPAGMNPAEFDRQLAEQMNTIKSMTADDMAYANWVLEKAGTTSLLRDHAAQKAARDEYRLALREQGLSAAQIETRMASVNATHFLDIVAGGNPSAVGIGAADVNQEIGRQWVRDGRVETLRQEAAQMRVQGLHSRNMDVELKRCQ